MLETCGDAESQLALELSQHEVFVEKEVVDPLCGIAEVRALRVPGGDSGRDRGRPHTSAGSGEGVEGVQSSAYEEDSL